MQTLIYVIVIVAIVAAGVALKMYPQFPHTVERFSSPALAPNMPSCVQRNADAQALLALFPQCMDQYKAPSEDDTDRVELKLILNKMTCLESDVKNSGVTGYNTLYLPYNTSHDTEPITNFVGRCLNGGARTRDIALIMEKYEKRGIELISRLAKNIKINPEQAFNHYNALIKVTFNALTNSCKMSRVSLDRPVGVRDPGYSTPFSVEKLAPFARTMD
jgi:hypothetical protein